MNILITGGAGFVGSHLAETLIEKGNKIIIIDDFSNGRMENLENIKQDIILIKHDISKDKPLDDVVSEKFKEKIGGIFHLACFPRSLSFAQPQRDVDVNSKGMINVLELAKKHLCKVVFTSNSGISGEPDYLPIDEKQSAKPSTPYDANKLVSEYYCKMYSKEFNIPVGIVRFATVYGERQQSKPEWKPVIAEFISKILKGEPPTINGDGSQTRDFIYVLDAVQGVIKAFESDNTGTDFYILSTNTETSIRQIFDTVLKVTGKNIEPKKGETYPGDINRMKLSYDKAKKTFGYEPKYSLEQGVKRYIDWYKKEILK